MAHCWLSPEVGIIVDVIGMREMEGAVMSLCCRHCHVIMSWEKTRERKRKGEEEEERGACCCCQDGEEGEGMSSIIFVVVVVITCRGG